MYQSACPVYNENWNAGIMMTGVMLWPFSYKSVTKYGNFTSRHELLMTFYALQYYSITPTGHSQQLCW